MSAILKRSSERRIKRNTFYASRVRGPRVHWSHVATEGDLISVAFKIELEAETDGRWIAEVVELPGVLAYGATEDEAITHVQALALRVIADRLKHDEAGREFLDITFAAA